MPILPAFHGISITVPHNIEKCCKHTRDETIIQNKLPMIDEIVDEVIDNFT